MRPYYRLRGTMLTKDEARAAITRTAALSSEDLDAELNDAHEDLVETYWSWLTEVTKGATTKAWVEEELRQWGEIPTPSGADAAAGSAPEQAAG